MNLQSPLVERRTQAKALGVQVTQRTAKGHCIFTLTGWEAARGLGQTNGSRESDVR